MKKLTLIFRISLILAVIVALVTYPVVNSYTDKAQLVQMVEVSEGADLFGDVGEFSGSPQLLVVEIPSSVIIEGAGPQGSILVDKAKFDATGVYPRQLQTIQFGAETARTGALIASGIFLAGLLIIRWRMKALSPSEFPAGAS